MSSNIGPEAQAAYQKYLDAKSLDEKIKRLEEFLSLVPKHKATERIVALNRSRLAKLKREQEERKLRQKSTGRQTSPFSIKKEGIQVILISDYNVPSAGKTSLLNFLTGAAKDKIGKFTSIPEIGIYEYDKIRFQIVDMPSIMEGAASGIGNGKEIMAQLRSCDLICICVDLSRDVKSQLDLLLNELNEANIRINEPKPLITIEKTGSNKVQVFYLTSEAKNNEEIVELTERIKEVVEASGLRNAIVKIFGKITINQVVDALNPAIVYKKCILLGTKGDLPNTQKNYKYLKENYSNLFPLIIGTSALKREIELNLGEAILKFLNKIRIYTSNKGVVADKPLVLDAGSTVKDVALRIHKSFYENFDHAILIREGDKLKRKKVGLDYELIDKDIIEIHTT
ncbi:MAG: GTPase [Promethearchaeota archaeon]